MNAKHKKEIPMETHVILLIQHLANGSTPQMVTRWGQLLTAAGYQVTVITYYPLPNEHPLDARVTRVNLFASTTEYEQFTNKTVACKKRLEQYLSAHPQGLLIPFFLDSNLLAALCDQNELVITQTLHNDPHGNAQDFDLILRDWAIQKQGSVILQNQEQLPYFAAKPFQHVKKYVLPKHTPQAELVTVVQDLLSCPPVVTRAPLRPIPPLVNYQNYLETSLRMIKMANYTISKQLFDHARHTLQNVDLGTINGVATSMTKKVYCGCLRTNQFEILYEFLQSNQPLAKQ